MWAPLPGQTASRSCAIKPWRCYPVSLRAYLFASTASRVPPASAAVIGVSLSFSALSLLEFKAFDDTFPEKVTFWLVELHVSTDEDDPLLLTRLTNRLLPR